MSHPQWTISQDQKEGPRGSGSPHNLVSEKHLAVKGPARGTLLGRPSLRQPQTRGDAMLWASHGSRGARTSSALIQPRRLSFTLPTPVPQRTPRPSALILFHPSSPMLRAVPLHLSVKAEACGARRAPGRSHADHLLLEPDITLSSVGSRQTGWQGQHVSPAANTCVLLTAGPERRGQHSCSYFLQTWFLKAALLQMPELSLQT